MGSHTIDLRKFGADYADHTVTIKDCMSARMQGLIDGAGVSARAEGADERSTRRQRRAESGGQMSMQIDTWEKSLVYMEVCVVEWTVTDSGGRLLPATRKGYEHDDFDAPLMEFILDEMDAHYDSLTRTEGERLDLVDGSMRLLEDEAKDGQSASA